MIRKQLYIDEELHQALKELAAQSGRSEADHVREALRAYLPTQLTDDEIDLRTFAGIIDDDEAPDDLAAELDHYAYGTPKGHKRSRR